MFIAIIDCDPLLPIGPGYQSEHTLLCKHSGSLGDQVQTLPYEFDAESTTTKGMILHGDAAIVIEDDDLPSPGPRPSSSSSAALSPNPTVLEGSPAGEMATPPHLFGPNIKSQVMSPTGPWPRYEDMCDAQPEDMSTPEIYRQEKAAEDLKWDQYLTDLKPAGEAAQVCEPSGGANDDEIPIVTRREQWGTDAKSLAADAAEDPDADYDPTKPEANDAAPAVAPKAKAKAKSRNGKAKAKAKSTATAKAKAVAKAKAKARREELKEEKKAAKEAKIKETKARAKRLCTVRPGASAESSPPEDDHVPGEIPSSLEPGKPADEVQPMEVDAECNQGEGKKEEKDVTEKARGKGESFAGRYMPQSELKATKYRAIRDTFVQSLSARLQPMYKFQDMGYFSRCVNFTRLKGEPSHAMISAHCCLSAVNHAGSLLQVLPGEA